MNNREAKNNESDIRLAPTPECSFYTGNISDPSRLVLNLDPPNPSQPTSSHKNELLQSSEMKLEFLESDTEIISDEMSFDEEPIHLHTVSKFHEKNVMKKCPQCNVSFPTPNELSLHFHSNHVSNPTDPELFYSCNVDQPKESDYLTDNHPTLSLRKMADHVRVQMGVPFSGEEIQNIKSKKDFNFKDIQQSTAINDLGTYIKIKN